MEHSDGFHFKKINTKKKIRKEKKKQKIDGLSEKKKINVLFFQSP